MTQRAQTALPPALPRSTVADLMGIDDSRRGFLRNRLPQALRDGARAREALTAELARPSAVAAQPEVPLRPWASPASTTCTEDRLAALADEYGLAHRLTTIQGLVRPSLRLVPEIDRRLRLGDPSTAPEDDDLRAALDLRTLDPAGLTALEGLLLVRAVFPRGSRVGRAEGRLDVTADVVTSSICETVVGGSVELVVPRTWAAPVERLGLDPAEQDAWTAFREALAIAQRIDPLDSTAGTHRLNRLLGYPDERTGTLPLVAELFATGRRVDDFALENREATEERAQRWTMLLQLQPPDDAGTVTIWIDSNRLARRAFRKMLAIRPAQV
jgi:hypothetical protein